MTPKYGRYVRMLHSCTDQAMTNALASMELTAAQGHVMGYLAHQETAPCPKDVEEVFRLSHPTVSGLLARLEKKGFIQMRPDELDHRCKRIYLLPKGQEVEHTMHRTITAAEEQMVKDFTQEEKQQFAALLQRAIVNMGAHPCHRKKCKEETNE